MAAIAEKDAHIALLEQSHERPRDEIETLRTHKEKLIEKLKQENERRAQLINSTAVNVARTHCLLVPVYSIASLGCTYLFLIAIRCCHRSEPSHSRIGAVRSST